MFILGLNSCIVESEDYAGMGYVDPDQLADAAKRFAPLWDDVPTRIAVLHHHLVPVSYNEYNPGAQRAPSVTLNTQQVIERLLELNFQLVLHGHQHQPFYGAEKRFFREDNIASEMGNADELLVIGAGSAGGAIKTMGTIGKRSLNLLTLQESEIHVSTLAFEDRKGPVRRYVSGSLPLRHRPRSQGRLR